MKLVKPYDIFKIASPGHFTCLTIYINNPRDINTLMAEAKRVAAKDLSDVEVSQLLAPVRFLVQNKKWTTSNEVTGIFVTKGFAGFMKIPFETQDLAVVANSFHVKPLLKWLQREKPFYLLHLDPERAWLFQGSMAELKPVDKFNYKKSKSMDFALDLVEGSVFRIIQKSNQALMLSGDPELIETYKNLCQYKMLVEESINELDAEMKLKDLHQGCLLILEPYLENVEDSLVKKYWSAKSRGRVSADLNEIVSLALTGQIKHLFVNEEVNIWGRIDYRKGTFTQTSRQMDAQDDDILDDLAELVLYHHGSVTVLSAEKMPDRQAALAILRVSTGSEVKLGLPMVGMATPVFHQGVQRSASADA